MKRGVLIGVPTVLLLGLACGNAETPKSSFKTSTRQAASIEAMDAGPIRRTIAFEDTCTDVECSFAAALLARWDKIANAADTLVTDLERAKPVAPEVSQLTDQTVVAASKVVQTEAAFHACAHQAGSITPCTNDENAAEAAWRALPAVLDGWKPYGGA